MKTISVLIFHSRNFPFFLHSLALLMGSVGLQDSLLDLVMGLGAPHDQLIISIPATALRFTLSDVKQNTPRSPAIAGPVQLTQTEVNKINHTRT